MEDLAKFEASGAWSAGLKGWLSLRKDPSLWKERLNNGNLEHWHADTLETNAAGQTPVGWHTWAQASPALHYGPSGKGSLETTGAADTGIALFQWVPVQPGRLYHLSARIRTRVSPGNRTYLMAGWQDAAGQRVGRPRTFLLTHRNADSDWQTSSFMLEAPPQAATAYFGLKASRQNRGDFLEATAFSILERP